MHQESLAEMESDHGMSPLSLPFLRRNFILEEQCTEMESDHSMSISHSLAFSSSVFCLSFAGGEVDHYF